MSCTKEVQNFIDTIVERSYKGLGFGIQQLPNCPGKEGTAAVLLASGKATPPQGPWEPSTDPGALEQPNMSWRKQRHGCNSTKKKKKDSSNSLTGTSMGTHWGHLE